MLEFHNTNIYLPNPKYFYRVTEFVTTMESDPGKNQPYEHTEDFKGNILALCRTNAIEWYKRREEGLIREGRYFLPFAAPKDFVLGKNAAYSITLSLVEYYNDDFYLEHYLLGEEELAMIEGREVENMILGLEAGKVFNSRV